MYTEVEGNIFELISKDDDIDIIAHGCNCFCRMNRGIAVYMRDLFGCNNPVLYSYEDRKYEGNTNKLGMIQGNISTIKAITLPGKRTKGIDVYNMYTQYHWLEPSVYGIPLDYDALRLCLRKLNHKFKDSTIALPQIGCGLAGGDWERVKYIIQAEITKNNVIVVKYKKD